MYASGMWIAKKGHEEEFARIWQAAADEASLRVPGGDVPAPAGRREPETLRGLQRNLEERRADRRGARPALVPGADGAGGQDRGVERALDLELAAEIS